MIKILRSSRIRGGKVAEATQHAKAVASYVNQRFAPTNVQVFVEIFGDAGTLYWITDVESVAAMEDLDNQLNAGPEFQRLLAEGFSFFVEGSFHDTLLRSV
jgi:hypothetical protein